MAKLSLLIILFIMQMLTTVVTSGQSADECNPYWKSKAVFIGRVVKSYRGVSKGYNYVNGDKRYFNTPVLHIIFQIERAFTGFRADKLPKTVEVECEACLYNKSVDESGTYLVYAHGIGSKGSYPLATREMRPISQAADEIKSLEQLTAPRTIAYDLNRVIAGIISGKAVSIPRPSYPEMARAARVSGIVTVAIILDPTGKVIRAEAVCGPQLLRVASEEAAKKIRYAPTLISGKPVPMGGLVTFNFALP